MTRILVWARGFRAYRAAVDGLARRPGLRIAVLAAVPLAWMLAISFQDRYPLPPGETATWTLRHYQAFFERPLYLNAFLRSFVFATGMTVLTLLVMFPVAYYLSKVAPPGWRIRLLLLVVAPFWVSEIVRSFAWMLMLANSGAINAALRASGLVDRPVELLYNSISLTVGVLYLSSLYMLLPLYAAIEKIDDRLLEAAADLGAGPVRRFWRIVLPLSRDGVVAGCTLVFLLVVGLYAMPQLLGGPRDTMFAATIGQVFGRAGDSWPLGSSFSMILIAAALAYVGLFVALFRWRPGRRLAA
jgi:spermidine/putrescine transport system permease protein